MPKRHEDLKPEPPAMILLYFPDTEVSSEAETDAMNDILHKLFGNAIDIDWRDNSTVEITNFNTHVTLGRKLH